MQRPHLLLIVLAIALVGAGIWWFTQFGTLPPVSSPNATPQNTPSAANPETASAGKGPATETVQRTPVEESPDSAAPGTNVLRVILEGVTEEDARMASVKLKARDETNRRLTDLRDPWPCPGTTSEFDLDPFLADAAERGEGPPVAKLDVEVDHPDHVRARGQLSLARDGELTDGKTVYEFRARLVRPEYWPEFTLAVRDAHTLAHLEDVELRSSPAASTSMWGFNGISGLLGDGLSSPITLAGGRNAEDPAAAVAHLGLWPAASESPRLVKLAHNMGSRWGVVVNARAPGYAWGSIVLDMSKSKESEILLKPGSALEVQLTNMQLEQYRQLAPKPRLCVYWIRPDGGNQYVRFEPLHEALATEGFRLEGLKPGGYRVTVELGGGSWTEHPVLAREELSGERALVAGETRRITLALNDPPAPAGRATLGGTVSLPANGLEEKVRLQLYFQPTQRWRKPDVEFALADLPRGGGALPSWSFRAEDMPVGMYRVQLLPFLKVWMVDVPAGGREDLQLVLPELAEVVVETVDQQTGERVPLDEFHYRRKNKLPGQRQHDRARADTEEPGRFRFWTEPGSVSMWPRGQGALGYATPGIDVELVPGRQSVRFELALACRIRFEFRIGSEGPRLSDGVWDWMHYGTLSAVRAVDHDGRSLGRRGERITEVSKPGVYEIDFDGFTKDRFHPIPKRLVNVRAGEPTEVIVELRRR